MHWNKLAAGLLAAVALVATAEPAHAGQKTHKDPVRPKGRLCRNRLRFVRKACQEEVGKALVARNPDVCQSGPEPVPHPCILGKTGLDPTTIPHGRFSTIQLHI